MAAFQSVLRGVQCALSLLVALLSERFGKVVHWLRAAQHKCFSPDRTWLTQFTRKGVRAIAY